MSVGRKQNLIWDSFQEIKINSKIRLNVRPCFTGNRFENEDSPKDIHNEQK